MQFIVHTALQDIYTVHRLICIVYNIDMIFHMSLRLRDVHSTTNLLLLLLLLCQSSSHFLTLWKNASAFFNASEYSLVNPMT